MIRIRKSKVDLNGFMKNLAVYFDPSSLNHWHFRLSRSVKKRKVSMNDLGVLHDRGYAFSDDSSNSFAGFSLIPIPFMQYAG